MRANGRTPKCSVMSIGPAAAEKLLGKNTHNRTLAEATVRKWASAMERGEWTLSWDAIAIGADGRLLNGQHRLAALVESGTEQLFLVVTDLDVAAMDIGDRGKTRTFGETLMLMGERNYNGLASTTSAMWAFEQTGWPRREGQVSTPTVAQLMEVLDRHPGMRSFVAKRPAAMDAFTPQLWNTVAYLTTCIDQGESDEFFEAVRTGVGLHAGDPRLTLRNRLLQDSQRATARPSGRVICRFVFRAWEGWQLGETLANLAYRPAATAAEAVPHLWGWPYTAEGLPARMTRPAQLKDKAEAGTDPVPVLVG